MKKSLLLKLFAIVAVGLSGLAAGAVKPEAGKVYRIVNKNYGVAVADYGPNANVACSDVNEANMSQRWYVSAGSNANILRFRSLGTGSYLSSSRALSQGWRMTENAAATEAQMTVSGTDGNFVIRCASDSEQLAMHCDGQYTVVCWTASIDPSKWDFIEIPMTQGEIDEALNSLQGMKAELAKADQYQTTLSAIYSDAACTALKPNYQSMSDAQLQADANFKALSATLQAMVLKTKNGNWTESYNIDGKQVQWDSPHAQKYRVQLYEPYSEGSTAAQLAGIQAYTNMNNPTGIIGNTGDILYVMVEGEIKEGATLYMNSVTGYEMYNNCEAGYKLHSGLNLVPIYGDLAHQFIYYTVATTEWKDGAPRRTPLRKVTDFDDLKIHIEGGQLNGFFNLTGDELYTADTNEDFKYTSTRARHPMYDMMGKYVILHFFLFPTKASASATELSPGVLWHMDPEQNPGNGHYCYDMPTIMKTWDDLCFRERTLMGLQSDEELAKYNEELLLGFYEPLTGDKIDKHPAGNTWNTDPGYQYSDYFNNRMMGITMQGDLYMNATSWRTAYNIGTLYAILNLIPNDSGSLWGPAHEYGHMNQGPIKFAGTTEESNNVFSNVVVYYRGLHTSRSSTPADQLNIFNRDKTYLEHSTWGTTRMFLQLWLYYHACGNNKKFYPRLYELLRNNPRQQSYYLNMRYDQCHFAKMCCIAAQEDLTDYFDSWGFFVPLENYHIGDYSNFMATLTEADIKAVKDEIKALGLPKNNQIILIDDRPGSKRESWYESSMAIEKAGELGGIEDFRAKVKPTGELSFTMRNDSLVVKHENGTGGVGFLVYDQDGTLLSFSNSYSFPLKKAATAALMKGTATVYAIGADGSRQEVVNDYRNAPISEHISNLKKLMASVADVHDVIDETETRAGWFTPFHAKAFLAAYDTAEKIDASTATVDQVTEAYLTLLDEYNTLKATDYAKVPFVPGSVYKVVNSRFPTHVLACTTSKASFVTNKTEGDEYQQWQFQIANAKDGTYRIRNMKHERYLAKPNTEDNKVNGTLLKVVENRNEAGVFTINEIAPGKYVLLDEGDWGYAIHANGDNPGGVIGLRGTEWDASRWYLELKEPNATYAAKARLSQLIDEAQALLDEAGTIGIEGDEVNLQEDMIFSNAKMQSGDDRFTSFNVLLDNDLLTYFHTNTDNDIDSDDGLNHYIGIDLGQGKELTSMQISWTNRDVSVNGGDNTQDDGTTATKVHNPIRMDVAGSNDGTNYTALTALTGLPAASGASYSSPVISDGNAYRYIRLTCTYGQGKAHNHPYFALAELGISDAEEVARPKAIYPDVEPKMMFDLRNQLAEAASALSSNQARPDRYNEAYDELAIPFNVLAAAMHVETVIEEIAIDSKTIADGIYDLQGRRLEKAGKGIFIINGVKTLVR